MMLPNELIWVMEKLGFEWPDIDEDEVRKGAVLVRNLGTDLESVIQAVDRRVNSDLGNALRGKTGPATLSAWNANRSQNLQKLVDIMPPAATAMDIGADAIFGLKMKVIVDVTTTLITLVAMLTNPITAAGSGPMLLIKKKLLNAAVDIVMEQLIAQLLPMAIEPMAEQLPAVIDAILDAPMVEGAVGDSDEFYADLAALEDAQSAMKLHGDDISTVTSTFFAEFSALDFGGDA
ncbi:WXG100-like domain-containing protein [Microbacterium sp. NPDC055903]